MFAANLKAMAHDQVPKAVEKFPNHGGSYNEHCNLQPLMRNPRAFELQPIYSQSYFQVIQRC